MSERERASERAREIWLFDAVVTPWFVQMRQEILLVRKAVQETNNVFTYRKQSDLNQHLVLRLAVFVPALHKALRLQRNSA